MYLKTLLSSFLLIVVSQVFAQRQADWKTELPATANQIFFHSLTGVPIIKGDDYYAGVDVQTHAIKWTIKRSSLQSVSAALGTDDGQDYFEVAYSPFAVVNNTLVDTRDGKILLDKEKDGFKEIVEYEILPDIDALLFRTFADGYVRLHLLDKKTGDKKWSANILKGSSSLLSGKFVTGSESQQPQVMVQTGTTVLLQNNQLMVFSYKKEVAMVNVADGKTVWVEKLDPAKVFFSEDQKIAFIVEHDKGGLVAQALSAGTKRMGKEITALDVATGKPLWKKPLEAEERIKWYDNDGSKLLVVHGKGFNFYNTADGKKIWKDDFDAKRISKIEENTEGYLVYYNFYRTMQIDKEGKKLWKKPVVQPDYDDDNDVNDDDEVVTYKYDNGSVFLVANQLSFKPKKTSKMKKFSISIAPTTKLEYDAERKTLLIFDKNGIHLVNPDKFPKGFVVKDVKAEVEDIHFVEVRKDNYYFSGPLDFVIVKPEGEVIERHYKEPFDSKAFLAGALNVGLSLGGAVVGTVGTVNAMKGVGDMTSGTVAGDEKLTKQGEKDANKGVNQMRAGNAMSDIAYFMPPTRHSAFSQTRDFAYFFTKDKATKEKVLIKVNKDSGEELDKLILNDARPLYKVDDVENRVLYADKKQLLIFEAK